MHPLLSLSALEVACDEGLVAHLSRLRLAAAHAAPVEGVVFERVHEALQIHLALLLERPDALWPVLYAHCAFVDSPRARSFGVSSAGPDMPVFEQVGRWLDERRRLHAGMPWLRALTPTTPWGGALVAELRRAGAIVIDAVTDDDVTFTHEGRALIWSLATGTTRDATAPQRLDPQIHFPEAGGLRLANRGGRALEHVLLPGWQIDRAVRFSENGQRLACVATDDQPYLFIFDTSTGEQLAGIECAPGGCAVSGSGRMAAACTDDGVVVLGVDTGAAVHALGPAASTLGVSDSGRRVALAHEGVVRVIDVRGQRYGWRRAGSARFSMRAGTVLLGDQALDVDGHVTALPPRRFDEAAVVTRLTERWLCVADPDGPRRIDWSTGQVVRVAGGPVTPGDRLAWSADGLVVARFKRGGESIELVTPSGRTRLETDGPLEAVALDWTGSQLALLFGDGTVQLQVRGARLRSFPGATAIAFLLDGRAIAVGGPTGTSVIGLDGSERWRAAVAFTGDDEACAALEVRCGLRSPSVAEGLTLTHAAPGLLVATAAEGQAVFPSSTQRWARAPTGASLASPMGVLSFET